MGSRKENPRKAKMGSETSTAPDLPTIDFSGLDLNNPRGAAWDATQEQVRQAVDSVGFFTAGFDKVGPELRDELFGPVAKALFSLPHDVTLRNAAAKPYAGYIGRKPGVNYQTVTLGNPVTMESIQAFTDTMWPEGNPNFRNTVCSFVKQVSQLELMVRMMVLENLGVGKYYASLMESTKQTIRITEYMAPEDQNTMLAMGGHTDMNLVTIIYQNHQNGLEVLTKSGQWLCPSPNTFTVVIGETFEAWSNGRLKPTVHRVRMTSNETRHSILFGSQYKEGLMIQAPEELVTEEHPMLFNPYEYLSYMHFRFSVGYEAKNALKAYCGISGDEVAA